MKHVWMYRRIGVLGTDHDVGPCAESEMIELAADGKLTPDTLASSPSGTNGNWLVIAQIPLFMKAFEEGKKRRLRDEQASRRIDEAIASFAIPPPDSPSNAAALEERPPTPSNCPRCLRRLGSRYCPYCGYPSDSAEVDAHKIQRVATRYRGSSPVTIRVIANRVLWALIGGFFLYFWLSCAGATILAPHMGHYGEHEVEIGRYIVPQTYYVTPNEELTFSWKQFVCGTVVFGLPAILIFSCLIWQIVVRKDPAV